MRLERIIMSGFKSFANKTVIELPVGVTAIVGPNGSGKSNLSEAIKWVLGEQSARSLRGKRMDDLIFSGTSSKKPVNVCEVSLVFNNEDGHLPINHTEVIITRRYHRNGESEMFINNESVRLKDVSLLLMDSGLGKDSFSMISQGRVEQIFNNRPEERRDIIEEVAGVLTYKSQKKEAERKLIKTEDHLSRLNDILYEIEGQLRPLKKQKEKAEEYLALESELSDLDIRLLSVELRRIKTSYDQLNDTLIENEKTAESASTQLQQIRQQLTDLKSEFNTTDELYTQREDDYVKNVENLSDTTGKIHLINERIKHAHMSQETSQQRDAELENEAKELNLKKDHLLNETKEAQTDLNRLDEEIEQVSNAHDLLTSGNKSQLEEIRNNYFDVMQQITRNEQIIQQSESTLQQSQLKLVQINENKKRTNEEIQQTETALKDLKDKESVIAKQLEDLSQEKVDIKNTQVELQKKWQHHKQAYEVNDNQLRDLNARYHSLKRIKDDYAGYYNGVRSVLKSKDSIGGVIGAVADVIQTAPQLEVAISTALGGSAQHIIMKTEDDAKRAIRFLRDKRLGRATFLPLNTIKQRFLSKQDIEKVKSIEGFVGVGIDLVEVPEHLKVALSQALGQVVIASNMESGQVISRYLNHRVRVVTLDGNVFNPGGSLTGGQNNRQDNQLLGRTRELEQLQQKIIDEKTKQKELEQIFNQVDQMLSQLQTDLQQITEKEQAYTIDISRYHAQIEQQEAYHLNATRSLKVLNYEYDMATEDQTTMSQKIMQTSEELKNQRILSKQYEEQLEQQQLSQEERATELERLNEQMFTLKTNRAVLNEQMLQKKNELNQVKKRLAFINEERQTLTTNQTLSSEQMDTLNQELHDLNERASQLSESRIALEEERENLHQRMENLQKTINALELEEDSIVETVQQTQEKISLDKQKQARFDVQMDQMLDRLTETYHMSFEKALEVGELEIPIEKARIQVKNLRQKMSQLGPVNVESINEYSEVAERFGELSTQKKDVEQAKDDLWGLIQEMDHEVRTRFKQTFDQVRDAFQYTFPRLFGGGDATLELTNPDDYLTTGIEIVAQPPGKKLQSLSLLSGGERAFTAIALLFAILKVKPVPFCLLDEVEAALDDTNVSRFGKYIRHFSKETQFMVITHRRGTMEEADLLYGVTMQEKGISSIASVQLEEIQDETIFA
ncbi:chromosome segregation protein SMC [Atopobacter phocae]|uniref:chromosome segregation protein SMC n=1 Tax=Atopobacter phocae TaxID=136492 RepID=UPI00046F9FE1|nr:chromosome segregation protein SMC [Atopobacter phocae]